MKHRVIHRQAALLAVLFALLTSGAGAARHAVPLQQSIDHLLEYVSTSGLTFLRNGRSYSAPEAADHMRRKYEHFRDDIASAEDFIRLCATRSLVSGKAYTVVDEDGRQQATAAWLQRELREYRDRSTEAGHAAGP